MSHPAVVQETRESESAALPRASTESFRPRPVRPWRAWSDEASQIIARRAHVSRRVVRAWLRSQTVGALPDYLHIARLTLAAVLAYAITRAITEGPLGLPSALTALLVVQASAYSTVKMGLVRVGAVLTGVLVAVGMSSVVGLSWWSLGVAVAVSLILARLFRLGDQALETPISALLILGVANQTVAAESRVLATLIGAATGVALTLVIPRRVPNHTAAGQVREVAKATSSALIQAGAAMRLRPVTEGEVARWLRSAGHAEALLPGARASVRTIRERRLLNPRALTETSLEPVLSTGLDTIDSSLDAVRALFRQMLREAPTTVSNSEADGYGEEIRDAFSVVLSLLGQCIATFGALVQAEAEDREAEVERALAQSLEALREARAFLTELLLVDAHQQTSLWLLRGSILSAVEQVLDQLDLEERARIRAEVRDGAVPRLQLQQFKLPQPSWVPAQRPHHGSIAFERVDFRR